jgi:hypothetical protein
MGAPALLINSFEFYVGRTLELEFVTMGRGKQWHRGTLVRRDMGSSVMLPVLRNAALFCRRRAHGVSRARSVARSIIN